MIGLGDYIRPGTPPQPVRAEARPCAVCGQEIQGGQLYIPAQPCHVWCRPPARLDVQRVREAARR